MKSSLVRDHDMKNPDYSDSERAAIEAQGKFYDVPVTVVVKAGTEIDDPEAHWLVRLGAARPVDDECRAACRMTDDQVEKAIKAVDRTAKRAGVKLPPAIPPSKTK